MINKIIDIIEHQKINPTQWFFSILGIIFTRFLFEGISSPAPSGMMPTDFLTILHYSLFFFVIFIGLIFFTGFFTKDYIGSSKIILFTSPIIWLAPFIDLLTKGRGGNVMSYMYDTPINLAQNFFKFLIMGEVKGITYGMYFSYILLIIILSLYTYNKNKKLLKTLLFGLSIYVFMFILGGIPSVFYFLTHLGDLPEIKSLDITKYLYKTIAESNILHNTLHEGYESVSVFRFFQLGFDKIISQIFFIISFFITTILFWKTYPEKVLAIIKNSRPERIFIYLFFILAGIIASYLGFWGKFNVWFDFVSFICLLISWLGIWLYGVYTNDINDIEIDKVTNNNRPLVTNKINIEEANQIKNIFMIFALVGGATVGFYHLFFSLIGILISYIYSVPPLRLKRVTILSSFLISTVCLSGALSGFYLLSKTKQINIFPTSLILLILICFTLEINFRDIKDIEGDKKEGIKTIPVLFEKNGKKIVGILFAISFILIPIFLSFYSLFIIAIPTAILGYKFINKTPYKEKYLFILHFIFIVLTIFLFFITH